MRKAFFQKLLFSLFGLLLVFFSSSQPNLDEGKALFKANCNQCHSKNMKDRSTGPALGGTEERWSEFPREDLYTWIRNSQAMVNARHPKAVELWNEWGTIMNPHPNLTDEQIESILAHINDVFINGPGSGPIPDDETAAGDQPKSKLIYLFLIGALALFALIMARVISNLSALLQEREGGPVSRPKTVLDMLTSKGLIGFLIFALIIIGGYRTVNNAIALGKQQGYAPQQPIKFSHKTHAGVQGIDCQFCHDGARRSKHAVIPAANTCIKCHAAIKKGSTYGTAELTKIYASLGWDPSTGQYIDGYDEMTEDQIKDIYSKWISDSYKQDNGLAADDELDRKGKELLDDQWEGIRTALTNDDSEKLDGSRPIEWVRIHNLPDHVYFNHSQHVTAGKIECQTCHGRVEEMEIMQQAAPLSMGWCVNCHRETEVKGFSENNPYYVNSYKKYHDALSNNDIKKVTVADIGGLECQKCHY